MQLSKVAFIGGGHMGRALVAALLRAGLPATRIAIGEPDSGQRQALQRLFPDVHVTADNAQAAADAEVVVLAVKPQEMSAVIRPLRTALLARCPVVLSVAAGLRVADLEAFCGPGVPIVRAMPNRAALVGAGATGLYAAPQVTPGQRARAAEVMQAAGTVVWVEDEQLMDAVTAVSGSGPAYFFLLAEALAEAGIAQGLPRPAAERLAAATLHGAGLMVAAEDADVVRMRAEVTSKGGTTEAAVRALEAAGFRDTLRAAVDAATQRGRELAEQFGNKNT
jgi:pyrroline-5-carboxylate reductase